MWDQESKGVESEIRSVGSGITAPGSGITAPGSGITSHGTGISSFLGIRVQAVPFLWDQGPEFVTLFESRIGNLGTEMGSAM